MYDFTHCLSDSLEGITHSICTLEFEDHRPLYDWILDRLDVPCHPRQIEFARLNLTHTLMSKRKLLELVREGRVSGWDDPRLPTLIGLRRRGYTPEAIRDFCSRIGVAKVNSTVDIALLEHCLREHLNRSATRAMAVLDPVRLVLDNYPEGRFEEMDVVNNPEDPSRGTRRVPFSRELFIERSDFLEDPPKKFHRLSPGREVRLMNAYYIRCRGVVRDPETGRVTQIHATYDPDTRGGWSDDGRKVKGTLHWVSAPRSLDAEVRIFDHLFSVPAPGEDPDGRDYREFLNPDSRIILTGCKLEPSLAAARPGEHFQFLRNGYFCADSRDHREDRPVFNRSVSLRDSWARKNR
jgi:glutaminyl-tRNA synthetase